MTAKREPVSASRVASPSLGNPSTPDEAKPPAEETMSIDEVSMETDASMAVVATVPEVRPYLFLFISSDQANRVPGFLNSRHFLVILNG